MSPCLIAISFATFASDSNLRILGDVKSMDEAFASASVAKQFTPDANAEVSKEQKKESGVSNDPLVIDKGKFSKELPEWINELFFYLESMAIHRNSIDWEKERKNLIDEYQTNPSDSQIIEIVKGIVQKAGGDHSFFIPILYKEAVDKHSKGVSDSTIRDTAFQLLDNRWGYIPVATYYLGDSASDEILMTKLATAIRQAEQNNVSGLIIDLSDNGGGNLYPPLVGLSPILENGDLGFFYDPVEKTKTAWTHKDGTIEIKDEKAVYWSIKNKEFFNSSLRRIPKAILVSNHTGSSGEFLLISLTSQEHTKVFGQPTAGLATGNEVITLSDGSQLILTVSLSMNVRGEIYDGALMPDFITSDLASSKIEAVKWLESVVEEEKSINTLDVRNELGTPD